MADENEKTLKAYNENAKQYVQSMNTAVEGPTKQWLDDSLLNISSDAKILEIGTASDRDAQYIESLGYTVQRSDGSLAFVKRLQDHGKNALLLNVLSDELPSHYDIIFANAVLLHFTPKQSREAVIKIYNALHPKGIFSFTVIKGKGEVWSDERIGAPRYFYYWQQHDLTQLLHYAGFEFVHMQESQDMYMTKRWLYVIAQKV